MENPLTQEPPLLEMDVLIKLTGNPLVEEMIKIICTHKLSWCYSMEQFLTHIYTKRITIYVKQMGYTAYYK